MAAEKGRRRLVVAVAQDEDVLAGCEISLLKPA